MATPEYTHTYSEVESLLSGTDMMLPSELSAQAFVEDAAKEIDSRLGFMYRTPLQFTRMDESGNLTYVNKEDPNTWTPSFILINRASNNLASGRLLLALASPEENSSLHAYGLQLIRDAEKVLNQITNGRVDFEAVENETSVINDRGPKVVGRDSYSRVEYINSHMNLGIQANDAEAYPTPYRNPLKNFHRGG